LSAFGFPLNVASQVGSTLAHLFFGVVVFVVVFFFFFFYFFFSFLVFQPPTGPSAMSGSFFLGSLFSLEVAQSK